MGAKFEVNEASPIEHSIYGKTATNLNKPDIVEYTKSTDVKNANGIYTYNFKIENFISENKVVDFKKYVEEHKNDLVIIKGDFTFDDSKIEPLKDSIVSGDTTYYCVKTFKELSEYKLSSDELNQESHTLFYTISDSVDIPNIYVKRELNLSYITENVNIVYLAENTVVSGALSSDRENKLTFNYPTDYIYKDYLPEEVKNKIVHIERKDSTDSFISTLFSDTLELSNDEVIRCFGINPQYTPEQVKIGLNGTFNGNVYVVNDLDSPKALKAFLSTMINSDVILPDSLKIDELPESTNTYIVPYSVSEVFNIAASKNYYSDNELIEPKEHRLPIWKYQFPDLKLYTGLGEDLSLTDVKLSDDLNLEVSITRNFESYKEIYEKGLNKSFVSLPIEHTVLYTSEKPVEYTEIFKNPVVSHEFGFESGIIIFRDPVNTLPPIFAKNIELTAV